MTPKNRTKNKLVLAASGELKREGTITAEVKSGVAHIRIKGFIGAPKANAEVLAEMVDGFLAKGISTAIVFLSSGGGSVFEAEDMIGELNRLSSVKLQIGAICASAATMFLVHFTDSEARSNSQFMIHKPMHPGGGNEDEMEGNLQAIKNITSDYRKAYAARLKKTEEDIEAMWGKGDKWLTATEAKAMGLIHRVINSPVAIDTETAEILAAAGAPVTKITQPKPQKNKMEELEILATAVDLPKTATATDFLAKIQSMKNEAATLKAEKDELQVKNEKLENEAKEMQKAGIKALLDEAVAANKIKEADRPVYEALAEKDLDNTRKIIAGITPHKSITSQLGNGGGGTGDDDKYKGWTFDKFQKEAPNALASMKTNEPEKYKQLLDEYKQNIKR